MLEKSDVVQVKGVRLTDGEGEPTTFFEHGEDIFLEFTYIVKRPLPKLTFTYTIHNSEDVEIFASDRQSPKLALNTELGEHKLRARLVSPPLLGGAYKLSGELWNNHSGFFVNHSRNRAFTVEQDEFLGTGIAAVECELVHG